MNGMAVNGILFDNDGTLVDTYDLILSSLRFTTQQVLGKDFPEEELMRGVGIPLDAQVHFFTDDPVLQKELMRVYREHNHEHHN